jgi:hypothetical protein
VTSLAVEVPLAFTTTAKRFTWLVVIVIVGIGLAAWLAAVGAARPPRALDPRDASPVGARALAELVRQRGVAVSVVTDASQLRPSSDTTVVISDPSLLGPEASTLADSGADVVLMAPDQDTADTFGIDVRSQVDVLDATPQPHCDVSAAQLAGGIAASGISYRAGAGVTGCYPAAGGDLVLVGSRAGATTVVLGAVEGLFNKNLARAGNAALGINLLTMQSSVVWLAPPPIGSLAGNGGRKGLFELLPSRLLWAVAALGVAIVLLALWRGRRLGPVVAEPLPVVVRATETVEGKARLLRAARARGQAARALRASALRRLSGAIHAGSNPPPDAVTAAVAARGGRDEVTVRSLLYGAEPASDEALVVLADQLDELEAEVRRQ